MWTVSLAYCASTASDEIGTQLIPRRPGLNAIVLKAGSQYGECQMAINASDRQAFNCILRSTKVCRHAEASGSTRPIAMPTILRLIDLRPIDCPGAVLRHAVLCRVLAVAHF